ncbi:MAG: hypothetical protein ABH956_01100 [Candidatus Nealsonbacteria bacterium]
MMKSQIKEDLREGGAAVGCFLIFYIVLVLVISGITYCMVNEDIWNLKPDGAFYSRAFPFWAIFLIIFSIFPIISFSLLFIIDKIISSSSNGPSNNAVVPDNSEDYWDEYDPSARDSRWHWV